MKSITISDAAYAVLIAHAQANGETILYAMDELFEVANEAWDMNMPEMKKPWAKFNEYKNKAGK
jgi:hypothetical protein